MNRRRLCLALLATALATSCGGSSDSDATAPAPSESPSAVTSVTPMPDLVASPAPAGFPAGDYARVVKLQGDIDGRWLLSLKADGRYQFTDPQSRPLDGTFEVVGTRMVWHDADCGDGTYTFAKTAAGLSFTEVTPDACAEDRHALLAGHEWLAQH